MPIEYARLLIEKIYELKVFSWVLFYITDNQTFNIISKNFCKKSFEKICKSKKKPYLCQRNEEARFSSWNHSIGY